MQFYATLKIISSGHKFNEMCSNVMKNCVYNWFTEVKQIIFCVSMGWIFLICPGAWGGSPELGLFCKYGNSKYMYFPFSKY